MYQIKSIEGRKLINGFEIRVTGELCIIYDGNNVERFSGNYDSCVNWITARNLLSNS